MKETVEMRDELSIDETQFLAASPASASPMAMARTVRLKSPGETWAAPG
jgi:hypothetical protein